MAKKTNVSMEIGVDLELLLGKIADKGLFGPVKTHLDQLAAHLKGAKAVPLEMKLDTKPASREFERAMKLLQREFAAPLRKLGTGLTGGNIASELSRQLREAGDTALKEGKITKEKLASILQSISKEVGIKGTVSARGKNPLKEFLSLTGVTLDDAIKSLDVKSKAYESAINKLVKSQDRMANVAAGAYTRGLKVAQGLEQKAHKRTMDENQKKLDELQAKIANAQQYVSSAGTEGGPAERRYGQIRTRGSGASKKDNIDTAGAYKAELVKTRDTLLRLNDDPTVSGFLDKAKIAKSVEAINNRIGLLNKELTTLTGNFNHAEEGASLASKQVRNLTEALEKQMAEAKRSAIVSRNTGAVEDVEKRIAALKKLSDTYRVLGELTGNAKFTDRATGVDAKVNSLEREVTLRRESLLLQAKLDAASAGERNLGILRKYAAGKDLLKALQDQANLTQKALVAMDAAQLDPTELRVYQDRLIALRQEANALKKSLDSQGKPTNLQVAQDKSEKARLRLETASEQVGSFSNAVSSRERLQSLSEQRKALKAYITSLEHLRTAEKAVGQDSGLTTKIKEQRTALAALEQQISGVDSVLVQLGRAFDTFLRYAVAYQILYQIQNAFQSMATAVLDLQHALVGIKAIANATSSSMDSIEASIKAVAETTSFTTEEIAKGAQTLAQAGVPIDSFGKVLRATANLASSTGSSFEVTAGVISTFMNVFKELDIDSIADKLRNAVNISKLTMEDLTSIANYMLETTEAFNISIDTTLAAAATLRNAGFKASTIATGGRQAILELLSPDKKTLTALQARYAKLGMNLSQDTIRGMFVGFKNASDPLMAVLNELEKLGMGSVADDQLSRVFDVRAENAIRGLINNRDELLKNKIAMQQTGTAAQGAKTQLESLRNQFQNLGEAVVTLVYDQSKGFVGWLKDAVTGMTELVKKFQEMQTALKASKGETGVGASLQAGGATTAVLATVMKLSVGWSAFFGLVIGGLELFAKHLGNTNTAMGRFFESISSIVEKVSGGVLDVLIAVAAGKAAGTVFSKAGSIGGGIVKSTKSAASKVKAIGSGASAGSVEPKSMSDMLGGAKSADVAGDIVAVVTLGSWVKNAFGYALTALKLIPAARWVTLAISAAAGLATWYSEAFGGVDETTKAKNAALAKSDAAAANTQKLIEQKSKQDQLVEQDKANAKAAEEIQNKIDIASSAIAKYTQGNAAPGAAIALQESIETSLAVGTQSLADTAKSISEITGKAVDSYDLAGDIQKVNDAIQSTEAYRTVFVNEYTRALETLITDPENIQARAIKTSYEKLSLEQQAAILTTVKTVSDASEVMTVINSRMRNQDVSGKALITAADIAEAEAKKYKGQIETVLDKSLSKDQKTNDIAALTSRITEAVVKGQSLIVDALIDPILGSNGVFSDKQLSLWKAAARKNQKDIASESVKKSLEQVTSQQKVAEGPATPITALQSTFEAEAPKRADQESKRKSDVAAQEKLVEDKRTLLVAALKGEQLAIDTGASEEELKKLSEERVLREKDLAKDTDTLAYLRKDNVSVEEKLKSLKQSFYAGEQEIKRLEDELKIVHGAKLADTKKEAAITKDIFVLKSRQLETEKNSLADNLGKTAEGLGLGSAKGVSPEDLLKSLSGSAGSGAMKDNKELADQYKALAEVVNEEALLREKILTDLDNIYRKELEGKQKVVKKDYDAATKKVDTLKGKLQTSQDKLATAQEKLANAYEKRAEIEKTFSDLEREVSGKKKTKDDFQAQLDTAAATGSVEIATQTAQEAKGMIGQGLSKRDAQDLIASAKETALNIQDQQIATDQYGVNRAQSEVNQNTTALYEATKSQRELKATLEGLNGKIDKLGGQVTTEVDAAATAVDSGVSPDFLSKLEVARSKGEGSSYSLGYAEGGPIRGPGSSTSDSINISASAGEYMQPAKAVALYGQDFMDKVRNLEISPSLARAVSVAAKPLGGSSAQAQQQMQPVLFQVGNDMISAKAQPDAVAQFQAALRLQAVKSGRRA